MEKIAKSIGDCVSCHRCGLISQKIDLGKYKKGLCPRCYSTLYYKDTKDNLKLAFIYAVTALIFFIPSNIFPMMTFELAGNEFSTTFIQSAIILHEQGYNFVSFVVFLTAIIFPILNSAIIILIYLQKIGKVDGILESSLKKVYNFTKKTSFIEVYLLALLVGYIKLVDISSVTVHTNIYFFIAYVCFFVLSIRKVHLTQDFVLGVTIQNSYVLSLCLVITGLLLYVPANLFTMMNISKFGFVTPDTIMSGIISLATNDMLLIAIIVFIASIVIPLFKLLGMLFILLSIKFNIYNNKIYILKLFKFIQVIGKWSILDIYMVALLVSYVKDESVAYVEAGSAATFFTLVIVVTMLAAESFDTKLIWEKNE